MGLTALAVFRIGNRHGHATVVDKQLFACPMILAHDRIKLTAPLTVEVAELAVLIAIRILGFILMLQEHEGDTLSFELFVNL